MAFLNIPANNKHNNMKQLSVLFLSIGIVLFTSCGKQAPPPAVAAPTNLTVAATVSTDNSGNVDFLAYAINATTYEYNFGDGLFRTATSSVVVTHNYVASGTYTVNIVAKNTGGQISKSISVEVTISPFGTKLVWSDEFDKDGAPDSTKWGYDLGGGGWGNRELQYYTSRPENSIVQGGVLKIKTIQETYSGNGYTSARLLSKNKYSLKYGKVEISAKLPAGGGTWPAIWMLGSDISTVSWPACGEIDIMEHNGNDLNKIYGTLHYPGRSGGNADGGTKVISNATTEFHKYSLEWTAASIKIFVDDQLIHSVVNSTNIPFNHDFFFILNVAMGGAFGGAVDPAFTNSTMEVDYIRVYK